MAGFQQSLKHLCLAGVSAALGRAQPKLRLLKSIVHHGLTVYASAGTRRSPPVMRDVHAPTEGIKVAMPLPLLLPCYKLVTQLHPVREGFAHLVMDDTPPNSFFYDAIVKKAIF